MKKDLLEGEKMDFAWRRRKERRREIVQDRIRMGGGLVHTKEWVEREKDKRVWGERARVRVGWTERQTEGEAGREREREQREVGALSTRTPFILPFPLLFSPPFLPLFSLQPYSC